MTSNKHVVTYVEVEDALPAGRLAYRRALGMNGRLGPVVLSHEPGIFTVIPQSSLGRIAPQNMAIIDGYVSDSDDDMADDGPHPMDLLMDAVVSRLLSYGPVPNARHVA